MKILLLSDDFLPNPGGIAAHVYELSRALAALGHEVDLVAGHNRLHAAGAWTPPEGVRMVMNAPFTWSWAGYVGHTLRARRALLALGAAGPAPRHDVVHWHNLVWEPWAVRFGAGDLPRL